MSRETYREQRGYQYQERQPGISGRMDVERWEATYVGKGVWTLIPGTPDDRCMIMTGNAVTLDAMIPINHRLIKLEWKHTDGSYVDSVVATAASLSRVDQEPTYAGAGLYWVLYAEAASTAATTVVPFGEGYEYLNCRYRLTFTTTNEHFIFPRLWLQEIKP